jgi:chaperonin GroEL (HSP60 family)
MRYGLDLLNGEIRDNVTAGILEPTMSKVKSLKSAYEAAVSLLRIDDAIAVAPGTSNWLRLRDVMGILTSCFRTKAGA